MTTIRFGTNPLATQRRISSRVYLAVAMVEQGYGRKIALIVTRRLVEFPMRGGGQSQFRKDLGICYPLAGQPAPTLAGWTANPKSWSTATAGVVEEW